MSNSLVCIKIAKVATTCYTSNYISIFCKPFPNGLLENLVKVL